MKKQVDKTHYGFENYLDKPRWCSIWHQINEIQLLNCRHVLEIGPGPGVFKSTAHQFGIVVETVDLDPDLKPDHIASVLDLPFQEREFDASCAFQMLEHLPYEQSVKAFTEMARVSKRYIIISLPDAEPVWSYKLHIPKIGPIEYHLKKPFSKIKPHEFDGEHYWELNKQGYELNKVIKDLTSNCKIIRTYRVPEKTYHRFFVFEKINQQETTD